MTMTGDCAAPDLEERFAALQRQVADLAVKLEWLLQFQQIAAADTEVQPGADGNAPVSTKEAE